MANAFCAGIDLVNGPDGRLTMCQRRYADEILKRFGMEECKATVSSVNVIFQLVPSKSTTKLDALF